MKIEIDIKDQRVERLLKEMGPKGFGVYVMMALCMEEHPQMALEELMAQVNVHYSRNFIMQVIRDYGLFRIEDGIVSLVCACPCKPMPERPCEACAPVPITDYLHNPYSSSICEHDNHNNNHNDHNHHNNENSIREWLLDEANLPWRESVMMHSGQPLLLRQHWPQAVEFFITHLLAQDNMHRVSSLHDIRQYFANFCRTSVPSGRALQQ